MNRIIYRALLVILLFMSPAAFAETMRCGSYLVGVQSSKYEVLKKCGEPTYKEGSTWIYESTNKFTRVVHFDYYGKVQQIEKI